MKNTTKNYIARGRQVGNLDIVAFTVSLDSLTEIAHEYNGKMYVSFEIARLKQPDANKKTHTMYQLVKGETVQEVAEQKPTGKKGKK